MATALIHPVAADAADAGPADPPTCPDGAAKGHAGRYFVIVLAAVTGLFASLGMFGAIRNWQSHLEDIRLAGLASDDLQTINAGLKDATDLLYSLRAYFESLDRPPSRSEFQAFSKSLRERVVGLRDTGWAPRVTRAGRAAFEREVQASGIPEFQIRERNAEGKMAQAAERDEYFPILYSDPGDINRPIMGFDLNSEPMRNSVIARARAADKPAATPPVKLMNVQRPNGGLMSFIPVTARPEPGRGVPHPIGGIVLGAFETAPMIENILATKLRSTALDMYVFDPSGLAGNRLIYWHSASGRPAPDEASLLRTAHWQGMLELVDQRWDAIFVRSAEPRADWTAGAVLAGGLTVTGLLVGYLSVSLRRTLQLERLTKNLRETSDELRRKGVKLDHLARHDVLTGLPNRIAFRDSVSAEPRRLRCGDGLAVLYLDLDRFKAVNDTLGHPVGDRLLCLVAERLRASVREGDTITRLGGDEFAIAQNGGDQPHAAENLARRVIDMLSRPYDIDGQLVSIGASVGITVADRGDLDADQLLRRADLALYAAKRNGRGTWRFFDPSMDSEAQARRGLEIGLRDALERNQFVLCYQPQVCIADGRVTGFEALLRWQHPETGLTMPADFIQCAEETGLIVPIGAWVLRTACFEAENWPDDISVAVNLSAVQFKQDDLAASVRAALAASGLPPRRLELEITETVLLHDSAATLAALHEMRAIGVAVALDDFGTGYSSLSYLRSFPFDKIKIDRSFVRDLAGNRESMSIVRAVTGLGQSLNIKTTAEGVETEEQLEKLRQEGCTEAQGYLFSRPVLARELPDLIEQLQRTGTAAQRRARSAATGTPS